MKIKVRAVGLKAIREKRGLTQRKLAHDPRHKPELTSLPSRPTLVRRVQNFRNSRFKYFGCDFKDLFEIVLIDKERGREQVLLPR